MGPTSKQGILFVLGVVSLRGRCTMYVFFDCSRKHRGARTVHYVSVFDCSRKHHGNKQKNGDFSSCSFALVIVHLFDWSCMCIARDIFASKNLGGVLFCYVTTKIGYTFTWRTLFVDLADRSSCHKPLQSDVSPHPASNVDPFHGLLLRLPSSPIACLSKSFFLIEKPCEGYWFGEGLAAVAMKQPEACPTLCLPSQRSLFLLNMIESSRLFAQMETLPRPDRSQAGLASCCRG